MIQIDTSHCYVIGTSRRNVAAGRLLGRATQQDTERPSLPSIRSICKDVTGLEFEIHYEHIRRLVFVCLYSFSLWTTQRKSLQERESCDSKFAAHFALEFNQSLLLVVPSPCMTFSHIYVASKKASVPLANVKLQRGCLNSLHLSQIGKFKLSKQQAIQFGDLWQSRCLPHEDQMPCQGFAHST